MRFVRSSLVRFVTSLPEVLRGPYLRALLGPHLLGL